MNPETLNQRKINLIVRITKVDKEESLRKIEETVDIIEKRPMRQQSDLFEKLAKPPRAKLDVEELIMEQNWKPSTAEEIHKLIKEINFQASPEELKKELRDI